MNTAFAFLLAGLALAAVPRAHELKDISLATAGGRSFLSLSFAPGPDEGEYPLFFQKADALKGAVLLSFLETETAFPLGRHALDSASPAIEEVLLKKITSPSGKTFLGVELKLKQPPAGDFPIDAAPKNILKVALGEAGKKKYSWTLSKSLKSQDAYLSAKAEPAPPSPKSATPAAPIYTEAAPLAEPEPLAPLPTANVPTATVPSAPTPPAVPVKAVAEPLKPAPDVAPKPVEKVSITPPDAPKPAVKAPETAVGDVESFPTAHDEGLAMESKKAGVNGLSSSRIFSLSQSGKTMVLLRDSVSLKSLPGPDGKVIRKIPIGEKVEKIGSKDGRNRVVAGSDTGYIAAVDAVYEDELTPAQEKAIKGRQDAKQAKLAAAAVREAEKARKAEEALAAAAAKEAEKARKAEEALAAAAAKQAAKDAEKARKAEEAAAAVAAKEAEKIRLAEAAAAASAEAARKKAELAAAKAAPLAGAPAAGALSQAGGPKLAIADNPELAAKLAQEKAALEAEKKRVEPEENRIAYNSYGRRDPFIPVDQGASENGIDIDQMKVVGIIWQSEQPMAVLEHNREMGVSFTIKEGDPVHNGRVARISRESVTFDISEYGISRSYSLKLVSSKEGTRK